MPMIGMRDVCWGFGDPQLLENITFQIRKGERICLVGRNGVGKSTLLKLLGGRILPDSGEVWRRQGIRVAALDQDVTAEFDGTIFEAVARGLGDNGRALAEYSRVSRALETAKNTQLAATRDQLQHTLDSDNGWALANSIENVLSRTRLEPQRRFADLSAGLKRRTLFAGALAGNPDLLLLDEPTNHLDIETILWMEDFIHRHVKTLLFITHDRAFVQKLAHRILELDRGRLVSYDCDYAAFEIRRQAALDVENTRNGVFDKKLSREEAWIRKGIKARRTRNEGRVRSLQKMRAAYRARRSKIGTARLQFQAAERTGKLVIEARSVGFSYGQAPIVKDFSTVILRGDKVGIIGPNGVGKTTLLKILLKTASPESGSVRHGTNLKIVYFDQLRTQLDEQKTVRDNIADGNDFVVLNDQKRHVISYLQDFLFLPERCRTPVHVLSGGEKNRLLLARLFTKPANVLVLDEPTNDLDVETLELLEELILEYPGTLLLVSHDRAFLNSVVTSTIVFEGNGQVLEYAGGYDDWLRQRPALRPPDKKVPAKAKPKTRPSPSKKLGYMQKREMQELPQKIEVLEAEHEALFKGMSDPLFYKKEKAEITGVKAALQRVEKEIESAYRRWEELEAIDAKEGS
ncbi:MAG: ATP-binding cassette domain-containing protein [Deltaproteobacteria bacterium]|nr:ATP-binding cassette domain-containing protein [Deltaproteobacteria bacterium]MBW2678336.1 ATP-binding cassette domain-containing protein [Deltaproteobacteria bacterium]